MSGELLKMSPSDHQTDTLRAQPASRTCARIRSGSKEASVATLLTSRQMNYYRQNQQADRQKPT